MSSDKWEPYTIMETISGMQSVSLRAKQLSQGIIRISGEIDEEMADSVISQIKYLMDAKQEVYLFINTTGGAWSAGLMIVDMMRMYKEHIHTICTSRACSVGAVILSTAAKGKRYIFEHANVIINEPNMSVTVSGNEDTIRGFSQALRFAKQSLYELLSENTDQSVEELKKLLPENGFLKAVDAIDLGLCDSVVEDLDFIKN